MDKKKIIVTAFLYEKKIMPQIPSGAFREQLLRLSRLYGDDMDLVKRKACVCSRDGLAETIHSIKKQIYEEYMPERELGSHEENTYGENCSITVNGRTHLLKIFCFPMPEKK